MAGWMCIAVVLTGCSGCLGWGDWDDVPTATITPIARPELQADWVAAVSNEAAVWNGALEAMGCSTPFVVGEGGHPVRLIPIASWGEGGDFNGATDGHEIRIIESASGVPPTRMLIIAHELGHAIGLHHSAEKFGPTVMGSNSAHRWDPRDAAAAACALGCGPCEIDADPYSIQ